MVTILLTGGAGFIGFHTAKHLLQRGDTVVLVDNLNDYYQVQLKKDRLKALKKEFKFNFHQVDISDYKAMEKVVKKYSFDKVIHLAAQAGVRYSLTHPFEYLKANMDGTLVIFELARHYNIKTVVYASSSSVYGGNKEMPFSEKHKVDTPISLYAATKKANELMAYTYHHLYGINMTGLRFFTVYGPWGRPDMALFLFADAIAKGKPIDVYNHGKMKRDFTYVSDIVSGVVAALDKASPYEVFNLGASDTVELLKFIKCIEKEMGKEAQKNMMPIQPGDVPETSADVSHARKVLGYKPKVKVQEGVAHFVSWFKEYYKIK